MKLEPQIYHMKTTRHTKVHFDPTMWVVSANTQFAIVRFLSLSFFLPAVLRQHFEQRKAPVFNLLKRRF